MITPQSSGHISPQEEYPYPSYCLPNPHSIDYPATGVTGTPSQIDGQPSSAFISYSHYHGTDQHQTIQTERFSPIYGGPYPAYYQADPSHNAQWLQQSQRYQYSDHSHVIGFHSYPTPNSSPSASNQPDPTFSPAHFQNWDQVVQYHAAATHNSQMINAESPLSCEEPYCQSTSASPHYSESSTEYSGLSDDTSTSSVAVADTNGAVQMAAGTSEGQVDSESAQEEEIRAPRPRGGATARKELRCKQCRKGFYEVVELLEHAKVHSDIPIRVTCPFPGCGRSLNRQADMARHYRSIHQKRLYPCQWCQKYFNRTDTARRHEDKSCDVRRCREKEHGRTEPMSRKYSRGQRRAKDSIKRET